MAASIDLTTVDGLQAYLEARSVRCNNITLLTGGTANYVYRASLPDQKTVIYKHAAPYLHSNTDFAFDPRRMDYEDRALETTSRSVANELPGSKVHAASVYSYDKEAKLLCIEDGGERNLKVAYEDPKLDIAKIGKELGLWLAALHESSTHLSLSLTDSQDLNANNPIGVIIYRHSYNNLSKALEKFSHDPKFGDYINEEFGSRLVTENETVCHGDFWPGNVLVKFADASENEADLTIVDWEMTRRGTSATDVGQFAAEAFLLDRFRGGRGLRRGFLDAYIETRKDKTASIGKEWMRRMAVHWGVHVAFWPTMVEWADGDGTQMLVDIGVNIMKAAVDSDWERLKQSELLSGTGEWWEQIWQRP